MGMGMAAYRWGVCGWHGERLIVAVSQRDARYIVHAGHRVDCREGKATSIRSRGDDRVIEGEDAEASSGYCRASLTRVTRTA